MNLTFKFDIDVYLWSYRNGYILQRYIRSEAKKYDITLRPNIIEFQMKNVTANDTGIYWVDSYEGQFTKVQLSISSMYIVTCCIFPLFTFCIRYLSGRMYMLNKQMKNQIDNFLARLVLQSRRYVCREYDVICSFR